MAARGSTIPLEDEGEGEVEYRVTIPKITDLFLRVLSALKLDVDPEKLKAALSLHQGALLAPLPLLPGPPRTEEPTGPLMDILVLRPVCLARVTHPVGARVSVPESLAQRLIGLGLVKPEKEE